MKHLIYIISISLLIVSCKKDDKEVESNLTPTPTPTYTLTYLKTIGGLGEGLNDFHRLSNNYSRNFAFYDNRLYVCDHLNFRVKRLDLEFNSLDWFAYKDPAFGKFTGEGKGDCCQSKGVVVKNSNMFIVNFSFNSVDVNKINTSDGSRIKYLFIENVSGSVGNFDLDSEENMYFQSSESEKIHRYDENGILDSDFEIALNSNAHYTLDEKNNIYVLDEIIDGGNEYAITKYNPTGAKIKSWNAGNTYYNLVDIYGGKLYTIKTLEEFNERTGALFQYNLDGTFLRYFTLDQWENDDMKMYSIRGFKVVKGAVIFVTDDNNRLAVFSMSDQ